MLNGIYQSGSGMAGLSQLQEVMAQNMANISTTGYKQTVADLARLKDGQLETEVKTDWRPGVMQVTQQPTHAALSHQTLFVVETAGGKAYTRTGAFSVDGAGRLATTEGHLVQGEHGNIEIGTRDYRLTADGEVVVGDQVLDRLTMVKIAPEMIAQGAGLWQAPEGITVEDAPEDERRLVIGALEGSNVNPVKSMVDLLMVMRLYESNQKAIEAQDETLRQLVNQVGRPE